jgi:dethiobiotin synthetase
MKPAFVIAGTDTDVGKTVFAAALTGALDGSYWKPIQSGTDGGGDLDIVGRLSGLPRERLLPEAYRLSRPLSPHRAAELDGVEIDVARLEEGLPEARPLIVEMAGGLLVPLSRKHLQVRLLQKWDIPVILVARTALGTINHSLLSIFALRMHEVSIHGIAFVGDANEDSERTISDFGQVRRLGRLPNLAPLDASTLRQAFSEHFRLEDFA